MSKKLLYFIAILAAIFIIGVVLILLINRNPVHKVALPPNVALSNSIASSTLSQPPSNSILGKAETNRDFNQCLATSTIANQDMCLYLVAAYLQNGDACQKLHDSSQISKCQQNATWSKAVSNRNLTLCSQITDAVLDQSCVANDLLNSPGATPADCAALPEREKTYCENYFTSISDHNLFKNAKNASDCGSISESGLKNECLAVYSR